MSSMYNNHVHVSYHTVALVIFTRFLFLRISRREHIREFNHLAKIINIGPNSVNTAK